MSDLTKLDALRAYARMMNNLSVDEIAPLLAEDFSYASQWVLQDITSRDDFLEYISAKLETIRSTGSKVWAEVGRCHEDCLVMAQGERENLFATVLARVEGDRIRHIDMCFIPAPESAHRTGELPS